MQRPISRTIQKPGSRSLDIPSVVDDLQAHGQYTFRRHELDRFVTRSDEAVQKALRRLNQKRRIASPRRGFYVIVPLEYRAVGLPPTSWFIDDLMKDIGEPSYYVGLLSAAALHGASHHKPQEFQVIASRPIRSVTIGRTRIRFFTKRHLDTTPVQQMKTVTGSMRVSTPEATALDLLRYVGQVGYLGNVATVLAELAESLDTTRLLAAARSDVEVSCIQRLGYLLEHLGHPRLAGPLARWLSTRALRPTPLRPDRPVDTARKNSRWSVLINEDVEAEA